MAEQQDQRAVPPAGRSRGPYIHSGGEQEIGAPVPPYEGRQETGKGDEQLREERGVPGHDAGSRAVSSEERGGVPPTDTSAASPLGVGEPSSAPGNEEMLGTSEEARRKDRQKATSAGVDSSKPIDPESPNLQPGDQGG